MATCLALKEQTSNVGQSTCVLADNTSDYIQYFNHGAKNGKLCEPITDRRCLRFELRKSWRHNSGIE